ncbi:hypothetical protein STCU_01971 [Strigomonas culicis]|uniref:Miltefosine transporter beta subunit n=1 Tax=Strigomonas culicis TaxID=28005 RepID=S9WCK1_9TRYP|nr:hypothetical protein STCU_01971 [Strigomonas culicis]|eukprot:EPY33795.1 hypothetical protein STCU_01971 [Strigomonas culicis]
MSNRHQKKRIEQQSLWHFYPRHTALPVALTLIIVTVFCIPAGVSTLVYSNKVLEVDLRYDQINAYVYRSGEAGLYPYSFDFNGSTYSTGVTTTVRFNLSKSAAAPVYLQYRLKKFYQNYRWFGASLDEAQNNGADTTMASKCNPFRYPGEVSDNQQPGYYNPCGALAWAMFNDSISLYNSKGVLICDGTQFTANGTNLTSDNQCHKSGIALNSATTKSFMPAVPSTKVTGPMWTGDGGTESTDPFYTAGYYFEEPGHKIPITTDEDFIVWEKMAYLADFSNMYRIIDVDLPAGEYTLNITENFNVNAFSGEKHVRLVTRTWIGGRNHILGILLVVLGCVSFVIFVAVLVTGCVMNRI